MMRSHHCPVEMTDEMVSDELVRGIVPPGSFEYAPDDIQQDARQEWDNLCAHVHRNGHVKEMSLAPESRVIRDEVRRALRLLTREERRVLTLHYLRNIRLSTIAKRMHTSELEVDGLLASAAIKMFGFINPTIMSMIVEEEIE